MKQEAQLMLTNPCDAFRGQSYSSIPYVRYSFLLCNRNFVFLGYSTSKNVVTLKTGLGVRQGHWRYHRLIEPI